MKKKRVMETVKTISIILLLCSAALLTATSNIFSSLERPAWLTKALRPVAGWFGVQVPELPTKLEQAPLTDAAQPLVISARTTAGRASWHRDFAALDTAFEALGGFLAEALDTAEGQTAIDPSTFVAALSGPGVYFSYDASLPLDVLAAWLDVTSQLDLSARCLLLQVTDAGVALLVGGDGGYFRYSTQLDATRLSSALEGYPNDGSFLSGEAGVPPYDRPNPLSLMSTQRDTNLPAASSRNPVDEVFASRAANLLGFNPYGDGSYTDDQGSTIYTESDCSLRISTDGALSLRNLSLSGRYRAASARDADIIEYARQTAADLTASLRTDGRLLLSGLEREGDSLRVRFDYYLAGIPITQADGSALEAVFSGEFLSSLEFRVRTYTVIADEALVCLPARQAAALAAPGGLLRLQYADAGDALTAGWISN